MATSNVYPGYGAVPPSHNLPPYIGSQGAGGQVVTANGLNGSSWVAPVPNSLSIGNSPDYAIAFGYDGTITTKAGTITADDWISVIKVMKQLIMDMSQDEELVSKYPYIRDAAHIWMMNKLKGE